MNLDYEKAKEMLLTSDIDGCQRFFAENDYLLELGYSYLLQENLENAQKIFSTIEEEDKRAHWGLFLTNLFNDTFKEYPTYFELRNFLEIDLNIFINTYKGNFVEKLISYADFFVTINPEVYKYIGRVFINNNFYQYGMFFLNRAKDYFYNDPELHYILAEYYYKQKDYAQSQKAINSCLEILPDYFPAKQLNKLLK